MVSKSVVKLFAALEQLCRGRPTQLADEIFLVRSWLTYQKEKRPSGYMNHPAHLGAYAAYHLPLHLPELFWILEQNFDRLKWRVPKTVLDLGCGPGTLSLSYVLWAQQRGVEPPEQLTLVDYSKNAVDAAKRLTETIVTDKTKVIARRVDLQNKLALKPNVKADWIFLGHVLNEWGSGPRIRERKMEFVNSIMKKHLNPGGLLFLVEPPLREPTLDLMWMRDQWAQEFDESPIMAPCPHNVKYCPMVRNSMGWCYAQPQRTWADERGLTLWDREIRRVLGIKLQDPGFAYLVLRDFDVQDPVVEAKVPHAIAITDENAPRKFLCTVKGAKDVRQAPPHRGAYIYREMKDAPIKP